MLQELSRREVRKRILPDPDIDAYMKASAISGRQHSVVTEYVQKILGLDICADTIVGNEMLRGISGGQRKRVTTGKDDGGEALFRCGVLTAELEVHFRLGWL